MTRVRPLRIRAWFVVMSLGLGFAACRLHDAVAQRRVVALGWQGLPGGPFDTCTQHDGATTVLRSLGQATWEARDQGSVHLQCTSARAGRATTMDVRVDVEAATHVAIDAPRRVRVGQEAALDFHGVSRFGRRLELGALAVTTLEGGVTWVGLVGPGASDGLTVRGTAPGRARVIGRYGSLQTEVAIEVVR